MTTSDSIAREPTFSLSEQQRNDREIDRAKRLTKSILKHHGKARLEKYLRSHGLAGILYRSVGAAALWMVLHRWSRIFLSKEGQRLGDTTKWLKLSLSFEQHCVSFHSWVLRMYPRCSHGEKMKALRILWIGFVIHVTSNRSESPSFVEDSLFAYALLYPLVDDFFDVNHSQELRLDFGTRLRERIEYSKPIIADWSSPHQESTLIGRLLESLMQRFPQSSSNRALVISILSHLIELELEKRPTDILFHAACKGGLTLCILHLIIFDALSGQESLHLMRMGLALQIVDDLQDIQEDINDQTNTLATASFYSSHDLRRQYAKAINFIRHHLFSQEDVWTKSLSLKDGVKRVFGESLSLLCMEAAARSIALQPEDRAIILQHSPLSSAFLRSNTIESTLYHLVSGTG